MYRCSVYGVCGGPDPDRRPAVNLRHARGRGRWVRVGCLWAFWGGWVGGGWGVIHLCHVRLLAGRKAENLGVCVGPVPDPLPESLNLNHAGRECGKGRGLMGVTYVSCAVACLQKSRRSQCAWGVYGVPIPNPRPVSLHRAVRGCMAYLRALSMGVDPSVPCAVAGSQRRGRSQCA